MEPAELDVQLEELEIRLERLRALYEQYFLGIEKIEPAIARKDVDRRIYILRREKIRNTAKRFKLQTIIQRYNTFQQYWQRICREIENGTYKRHLARAERTIAAHELRTIAARKRLGKDAAQRSSAPPPAAPETAESPASAARPSRAPVPRPSAAPASKPSGAAPEQPAAPPLQRPPTVPARARPAQHFESLELDMDFLGDWDPGSVRQPAAREKEVFKTPAPAAPAPVPAAEAPRAPPPKPAERAAVPAATVAARKSSEKQSKPKQAAPVVALNDERIKDLHVRLNDLKRKNQEAGQVSLDGLAKSLRATEQKLRQQHQGRRVDFDVVLKNGKAVVKPIIR